MTKEELQASIDQLETEIRDKKLLLRLRRDELDSIFNDNAQAPFVNVCEVLQKTLSGDATWEYLPLEEPPLGGDPGEDIFIWKAGIGWGHPDLHIKIYIQEGRVKVEFTHNTFYKKPLDWETSSTLDKLIDFQEYVEEEISNSEVDCDVIRLKVTLS